MNVVTIHGRTESSRIVVDEPLENLKNYLDRSRTVVITDRRVNRLYHHRFPDCPVIEIGRGERIKTLGTVEGICRRLVELEADRTTFIVGIGGGIVCDIAGFAASVYMRGLDFGFAPTTLLAQVDAGIGGKNGVNLAGYKNMIGAIRQPRFVLCDTGVLKTLSPRDISCGLAEIVKHAAIGDRGLFEFLERSLTEIDARDADTMGRIILDSLRVKADVVNRDERETGVRKILNFGHSFAHALEKTSGIPHGQAVSIGMVAAARISVQRKLLSAGEAERLGALLKAMKLPVEIPDQRREIFEAMKKDKKRKSGAMDYVLLDSIGHALIAEIPWDEIEEAIDDLR